MPPSRRSTRGADVTRATAKFWARFASRPVGRLLYGAVLVLSLLSAGVASVHAEQAWEPFKERDERAAERVRQHARDAKGAPSRAAGQAVVPTAPIVLTGPSGQPAFTPPPRGTVERVELAPLDAPAAAPRVSTAPSMASGGMPATTPTAPQTAPPPAAGGAATRSALGIVPSPLATPSLPDDLWRGVDMKHLETAILAIDVPPRSPALHAIWRRLMIATVAPPAGGRGPEHFPTLQLEALYRSGLIADMAARLGPAKASEDALTMAFRIRRDLSAAETEAACGGVKVLTARREALPKALLGEAHVVAGYCAAVGGNPAAAGLAAELAREEEVDAPLALQALDAIAAPKGSPRPKFALPTRLMVLDYRLLDVIGPLEPAAVLAAAEPALLYAIAKTAGTPPRLAAAAAEAAAALNAFDGEGLADVYRRVATDPGAVAATDAPTRRAVQFARIVAERDGATRLTLARPLLEEARKAGVLIGVGRALAAVAVDIEASGALGAAAATGAELALISGQFERARRFAAVHPAAAIWAPLAELADPALPGLSAAGLGVLDDAVRRNRFQANDLHRLATVLDALDTNVPIPLWEAASRTPQPVAGHLPETGTLPQLQDAAAKKELGRTLLLVMRTIGPRGADAAHLIALGDSLRALRRAGLDADARGLAFEALYLGWPRG